MLTEVVPALVQSLKDRGGAQGLEQRGIAGQSSP